MCKRKHSPLMNPWDSADQRPGVQGAHHPRTGGGPSAHWARRPELARVSPPHTPISPGNRKDEAQKAQQRPRSHGGPPRRRHHPRGWLRLSTLRCGIPHRLCCCCCCLRDFLHRRRIIETGLVRSMCHQGLRVKGFFLHFQNFLIQRTLPRFVCQIPRASVVLFCSFPCFWSLKNRITQPSFVLDLKTNS